MAARVIRSCLFCLAHHAAIGHENHGHHSKKNVFVQCTVCGARGPISSSEAMAIRHWNTRKGEEQAVMEALERARKYVKPR